MRFTLYEEYPTEENLARLSHIDFPVNLALAANSIDEFSELREKVNGSVNKTHYWPLLTREEGYWPNPFAKKEALERIINEINDHKDELKVVWDAELGFQRKFNFFYNRQLIQDFLKNRNKNISVVTVEAPALAFEFLGLGFNSHEYNTEKNIMLYTSMRRYLKHEIPPSVSEAFFRRRVRKNLERYGDKFSVSIGCLATGKLGNEPILTLDEFAHDIDVLKQESVENVYVFRLEGVTKEHSRIMKSYS